MDRFFEPTNLPQVLFRSLRSAFFCAWELLLVVPEIILESVLEVSTSGVVYFHDPTFLPGKLQRDLHFSTNSAQHAQKQIKPGAVLLSQRCLSQATGNKSNYKKFLLLASIKKLNLNIWLIKMWWMLNGLTALFAIQCGNPHQMFEIQINLMNKDVNLDLLLRMLWIILL